MSLYSEHVMQRSRERYNCTLTEQHQEWVGSRITRMQDASFVGRAQGSREEWQVFYKGIVFHVIWDVIEKAIVTLNPPEGRKLTPRMEQLVSKK